MNNFERVDRRRPGRPAARPEDYLEATLRCSGCGGVNRHRWHKDTPLAMLQCQCGRVGCLDHFQVTD